MRSGVRCKQYSKEELAKINSEPDRLGLSEEREKIVKDMREQITLESRTGSWPPRVFYGFDVDTMELLTKRVDSNVALYLNGSNISEKAARTELWRWYLIFKVLQPDAQVPSNPCKYLFSVSKLFRSKDIQSRLA
jgi:hypothetical protein